MSSEHLTKQIIWSSTSVDPKYCEAQGAESKADYTHKISIILKEFRETQISFKPLYGSVQENTKGDMKFCQDECDQLEALFYVRVWLKTYTSS